MRQSLVLQSLKSAGGGQGCNNSGGKRRQTRKEGMKASERGRGEGCREKQQPMKTIGFSSMPHGYLQFYSLNFALLGVEKWVALKRLSEFLFGFFPLLGFLQQQETQKIFLNKAWNWLFAFCLWNFLWLTNWTLIPSLLGKADALAATRQKSQMQPAERGSVSPAKGFINFKKVFSDSWHSLMVKPVAWQMPLRITL